MHRGTHVAKYGHIVTVELEVRSNRNKLDSYFDSERSSAGSSLLNAAWLATCSRYRKRSEQRKQKCKHKSKKPRKRDSYCSPDHPRKLGNLEPRR